MHLCVCVVVVVGWVGGGDEVASGICEGKEKRKPVLQILIFIRGI